MFKKLLFLTLLFTASAANAGLIEYEWTWTGTSGYGARGTMAYSDALAGTGVITASSISAFTIEGLSGTTSLFTWDLATGVQSYAFQLSFDTISQSLIFGGYYPTALDSVVWGDLSSAGLGCGTGSCGLFVGGSFLGFRAVTDKTQFTFTQVASSVSEPETLALLMLGLAGLTVAKRKKSA